VCISYTVRIIQTSDVCICAVQLFRNILVHVLVFEQPSTQGPNILYVHAYWYGISVQEKCTSLSEMSTCTIAASAALLCN
jgi:hypothetical protein